MCAQLLQTRCQLHSASTLCFVLKGLVQVKSAIDNKVEVSPSYLSLPTGQQKNSVEVSFTNTGDKPVAYKLEHTPAVAIDTNNAWYGQVSGH